MRLSGRILEVSYFAQTAISPKCESFWKIHLREGFDKSRSGIALSIRAARAAKRQRASAGSSGKRNQNAYRLLDSFAVIRTFIAGYVGGIVRANRHIDQLRSA